MGSAPLVYPLSGDFYRKEFFLCSLGTGFPPPAHPSGLQQMGCLWAQHPDSHIQASRCEPHHTSVLHPLCPQHIPKRGPWLPQP